MNEFLTLIFNKLSNLFQVTGFDGSGILCNKKQWFCNRPLSPITTNENDKNSMDSNKNIMKEHIEYNISEMNTEDISYRTVISKIHYTSSRNFSICEHF